MVFQDLLDAKQADIAPGFERLVNDALANQSHKGDFLLVCCNGTYDPDINNYSGVEPRMPYRIGGGSEGMSAGLHYKFINNYMTSSMYQQSYAGYLEIIGQPANNDEESALLAKVLNQEEIVIQLEMLIYLKIWEADSFIKRLYQITRLAFGEPYDWHFKIEGIRKQKESDSTGTRQSIIREKVRDRLQKAYPEVYECIKNGYITQIRNSIAHSNYSFLDRHIHPNNFTKTDPASQLQFITFNDWVNMLHETIVLYTLLIESSRAIHKYYVEKVKQTGNIHEIQISRKQPEEKTEFHDLIYLPETNRWNFRSNEEQ
ncbi:hypothetical protein [Cesiribacter andamanensis]|uniref:Uncharacterized protein n=1 Tax=Cesiribacter andamanensis AMV16 TaxID=1279009 RepID=M7P288_9BACT|nr:hypothetical protein [Cesiribacter andamanensis]EMR04679.1 hypothetical protein ADICEAN_00131 [Cesiribacter andamanensis AMV16]